MSDTKCCVTGNLKTAACCLIIAIISALIAIGAYRFFAPSGSTNAHSDEQINTLVADYIKNNPKEIIDSLTRYQQDQVLSQTKRTEDYLAAHWDQIISQKGDPVAGNITDPSVTIVEFFDYSCGYCKRMTPIVFKLLDNRTDIKFIFKEYPILSANSSLASKAALAANEVDPSKYIAFHKALFTKPTNGLTSILAIAEEVGLDKKAVESKMSEKVVSDLITANRELAINAGINGTPAFLINGKLIPGAVDYDTLVNMVNDASKKH